MRFRLHIIAAFCAIFNLAMFQACGVDPLEAPAPSGPPSDPSQEGYTVCQDPTIPDSNNDGTNDQCEALLGGGAPNGEADCNANNIPDGMEHLGPNCTPITDTTPCPPPGINLTCEEYTKEQNGQDNKNLNKVRDGVLLAGSGLQAKAPNGTKVEVQNQFIRIVYDHTNNPDESGLQSASGILEVCSDAPTFIYYRIEGNVAFCTGGHDASATNCGTPQNAIMELCAPLNISSNNPGTHVETDFKWTKGWVQGEKYTGFFDPVIFQKNKSDVTKLTLTPSTIVSNVYTKMDVKFERTFGVRGTIYGQPEPIAVDTTGPIVTLRKFKRGQPDVVGFAETPFIVGPWRASAN